MIKSSPPILIVIVLLSLVAISCSKAPDGKHVAYTASTKELKHILPANKPDVMSDVSALSPEEIQRRYGMNYMYYLSSKEIRKLALEAEKGDKDAAFKIYEHYCWAEYDKEKFLYWEKKAAENGHIIAQYNLAITYLEMYHNQEQGIYWLRKAAANGNEKAKERLRKY